MIQASGRGSGEGVTRPHAARPCAAGERLGLGGVGGEEGFTRPPAAAALVQHVSVSGPSRHALRINTVARFVLFLIVLFLHSPSPLQTLLAMQEDMAASSASHLLRILLQALRTECAAAAVAAPGDCSGGPALGAAAAAVAPGSSSKGPAMGGEGIGGSEDAWRCWWLPELVQTLYSGECVWSGAARHVSSLPPLAPLLSQPLYQFISTNPSFPPPQIPPFRL